MNDGDKGKDFYKNFWKTSKKPMQSAQTRTNSDKSHKLGKKDADESLVQSPKLAKIPIEKTTENTKNYEKNLQLAYYSDFQVLKHLDIIEKKELKTNKSIVVSIYPRKIPSDTEESVKFPLFFIQKMDAITNNAYYLLLHLEHINSSFYKNFLHMYDKFPDKYFKNLQNFYVISASFATKYQSFVAWMQGHRFQNKIRFVSSVEMQREAIFKVMHEEQSAKSNKSECNEMADGNRDSSSSFEGNEAVHFFQKSITDYELENNVPVPLLKLVRFFLSKPEFTSTTGIFRVNSTKLEEEEIENLLSKKRYEVLDQVQDPFVIANCIKKLIREIDQGLISKEKLEGLKNVKEKCSFEDSTILMEELNTWEEPIKQTFILLMQFLDAVALKKENQMTHYNLAVVFAPNIVKAKLGEFATTGIAISLFHSILTGCSELFPEPIERSIKDFKDLIVVSKEITDAKDIKCTNKATEIKEPADTEDIKVTNNTNNTKDTKILIGT